MILLALPEVNVKSPPIDPLNLRHHAHGELMPTFIGRNKCSVLTLRDQETPGPIW